MVVWLTPHLEVKITPTEDKDGEVWLIFNKGNITLNKKFPSGWVRTFISLLSI